MVPEGTHPVWTDTRNGHQDTFASVIDASPAAVDVAAGLREMGLRGYPNPSSGTVNLILRTPGESPAAIEILGSGGRLLRTLRIDRSQERGGIVSWDGADDLGRSLPAGVYFARLPASESAFPIRTKIVLAR